MTKMYWNIVLILLVLPLGESWHLFSNQDYYVNPWITVDYPYHITWFAKDIVDHLSDIIIGVVVYRIATGKLKIVSLALLLFRIYELFLYFYNFKQEGYGVVYFIFGSVCAVMCFPKSVRTFHE